MKKQRTTLWVAFVFGMLMLVLAACGPGGSPGGGTGTSITLTGTEFQWQPNTIQAQAGQKVTVVVKNAGTVAHDFAIPSLQVKMGLVQPGQTGTVTFTAPPAGAVEFICSVPGHKEAGMVGTLVVK